MSGPLAYLEALQAEVPSQAASIADLARLYERKLWHQVTLKLQEIMELPEFKGARLIDLYARFIEDFSHKLNFLKLSHIAVTTSKQYADHQAAVDFLGQVKQRLDDLKTPSKTAESQLYLDMHVALFKLQQGKITESKQMIDAGKEKLATLTEVDPSISAAVHYVSSLYHKQHKDFAEFYRSSLMYLCFVESDSLDAEFKLSLAVDISLAALLGEGIYSFGQLLLHPIIKVLDESAEYNWLKQLLDCFNHGDMHLWDELCVKHSAVLNAQPALVEHERKLREKITILCLMELIFECPPEERIIPLATIGARTKLDTDGVEFLLMKTLSLHLIEGVIDEVGGTMTVTWVQPRILTLPQISNLKDKLGAWAGKVGDAHGLLTEQGVGELAVV